MESRERPDLKWPESKEEQENFRFAHVYGSKRQHCLYCGIYLYPPGTKESMEIRGTVCHMTPTKRAERIKLMRGSR